MLSTILLIGLPVRSCIASDSIEFLSGTSIEGTVVQIRKSEKEFDFETTVGARTFTQTHPFDKIHAVTMKGKRFELNPKNEPGPADSDSAGPVKRTKAQVLASIADAGQEPPEWFDSVQLDYPDSLDLSWPLKVPTKGWNPRKNMGQYIWDTINPNPKRWRSGIRTVHHCMSLHQNEPALLQRDMKTLGTMYFVLLQDYPRAAFWYQKSSAPVREPRGIRLAECYWRLGNKKMALGMLQGKPVALPAIKLLGDMDELSSALRITKAYSKTTASAPGFLLAADALRQAGRLREATKYYQRVLDADNFRNEDYEERDKERARASIEAIQLVDRADVSKVPDGKYTADTMGYNGNVALEVSVAGGRIASVKVTSHNEKQFYAALTDTPNQIISKQGISGIDATSGATITSQAIVNATAKALASGAR